MKCDACFVNLMMEIENRPKIALLVETSRSYGRDLLRGVALFARTRTNWSLLHQEMTIDASLPDWMVQSAISGTIARVDSHTIDELSRLNVPIVDVRCRRQFPGIPQVETDDRAVAKLAFEHLWDRGFRRFAFCGFQFAHYSEARLKFFRQFTQAANCPLSVYESPGKKDTALTSIEQSGLGDGRAITQWLSSLDRPTGMLACNDIRGQQVLNICRSIAIAVPDDIGMVGVDDDDAICPLTDPPLTSVKPNAKQVGYRAAEILFEIINGRSAPDVTEFIAPLEVVQRLSTEVNAVEDREVARVCRFIREHACEGINVNDVAEFTTLSRRQLERRFRTEFDRTPHEEITAVQVARVKQLLCETEMTLEQITPLAGYIHKESLSAVFKRETNETPGRYRDQAKARQS
ncbi:MAG: DNA-binding transcriptional regulator [Fuerstiella sp.]